MNLLAPTQQHTVWKLNQALSSFNFLIVQFCVKLGKERHENENKFYIKVRAAISALIASAQ